VYLAINCNYAHAGGMQGIAYTLREHRHNMLFFVAMTEVSARGIARGEMLLGETSARELVSKKPFEVIGLSHVIVLHKPMEPMVTSKI